MATKKKSASARKSPARKTASKKTSTRKYAPSAGKDVETEIRAMKAGKLRGAFRA